MNNQEQDRDYHRAQVEVESFLEKVEHGDATVEDVEEVKGALRFFGLELQGANRGTK